MGKHIVMHIIVLSRNPALYSTRSIVNAGRKRGHYVRVVDHMYCDLIMKKNHLSVQYFGQELDKVDVVIPRIGASATTYGSAVIRQFESMGVFTTLGSEALMRSRDKLRSMQLLGAAGLGIPASAITNNLNSTQELVEEVGGVPAVIKLLVSTQGLGVLLAENMRTATSIFESFHRLKQQAMIQEYIAEAGGEDIRAFIVDGEVVASMSRQAASGDFRSNLHRGGTSTQVKLTEEERGIALKAARILGLDIAGVDLLRSNRGVLVLEVNASPGLEGIETTTGLDISNKIFQYVERRKRQSRK